MIDVFVVAILTALVQLGFLASINPGTAAVFFALSVAFTMLSAQALDPRLIWDTAEPETRRMPETDPPAPEIEAPRRRPLATHLAVWLVPLLALLLALGVAWRTYAGAGRRSRSSSTTPPASPPARPQCASATSPSASSRACALRRPPPVVVTARIDKDVARYVDADAEFWVVRPSVTAQGVTGIETVLSGVYIGASWDDEAAGRVERFEGLPRAPLTPADQPGLRISCARPTAARSPSARRCSSSASRSAGSRTSS